MLEAFIRQVKRSGLFDAATPIFIGRAPGRLDVMGGIADYSGSLVLQWPIREATLVAVQAVPEPGLKIVSKAADAGHEARGFVLDASIMEQLMSGDYDRARCWFGRDPA